MTTKTWEQIEQLFNPHRAVPKMSKSQGAIEFWREWDDEHRRAIWVKRYLSHNGINLDAFNDTEAEWLTRLANHKVPYTYRAALIERQGTLLAEPSRTTIKTVDCGPTLDDWLHTPVNTGAALHAHCLVQPEAFLQLALGILTALDCVHKFHLVHCDIHPGNITLPVHLAPQPQPGCMDMYVRWDDITLIDFGYALNTRSLPSTTLPMQHQGDGVRLSPHLQAILAAVEKDAQARLKPGERWENVWLTPAWWQCLDAPSPLEAFRQLDWREDLYQLGCMLADIRDGTGVADHLEGRTIRTSQVSAVQQLVEALPGQLTHWGSHACPRERPHTRYIHNIQAALDDARRQGRACPKEFRLNARDFDSQPRQAAIAVPSSPARVETVPPTRTHQPPPPTTPFFPAMVPLRSAATTEGPLAISGTPITWRQWLAACQHNPELHCPPLVHDAELSPSLLDAPITHVSYLDCLAYIETVNHIVTQHGTEHRLRLLTAEEWALAVATDDAARAPAVLPAQPVTQWPVNSHGLAGLHGPLWQWTGTQPHRNWAQVRGGTQGGSPMPAMDHYPTHWRSPRITLRLACHLPYRPSPPGQQ